jgi:hypothetical protein
LPSRLLHRLEASGPLPTKDIIGTAGTRPVRSMTYPEITFSTRLHELRSRLIYIYTFGFHSSLHDPSIHFQHRITFSKFTSRL